MFSLHPLSENDVQELVAQIRTEPLQESGGQLAMASGNETINPADTKLKNPATAEEKAARRKVRRTRNEISAIVDAPEAANREFITGYSWQQDIIR